MSSSILALSDSDKLTDNNYHIWKIKIETLLRAKNAWQIALEKEDKPKTAGADLTSWEERDSAGVIVLKLSISDPLLVYVENLTTTAEIWKCFEKLYGQKNKARIVALKEELFKIHMKETETVTEFMHKVISLRNDLLSAGSTISDSELVEMVASKLPKSFDVTINTITNNDQIATMTLDTLTGLLLRQEQRNRRYEDSAELEDAFVSRLNLGTRGRSRGRGKAPEFRA